MKEEKCKAINIIRSETWIEDKFSGISKILEETIEEYIKPNDRIINIEVKERNGLSRFWIYTETQKKEQEEVWKCPNCLSVRIGKECSTCKRPK